MIADWQTIDDTNDLPLYYIFQIKSNGFIIISGDYRAVPVIGFAFGGQFDQTDLPPSASDWLNDCARQIQLIRKNNLQADSKTAAQWEYLFGNTTVERRFGGNHVDPLLTTKWGQRAPYNLYCPPDPASPDGRTVTGCAATAIAQVMAYYNYPKNGFGSNSYYHPVYGQISANFEDSTYRWQLMSDSVHTEMPPENQEAVSLLCFHAGVAMNMYYGPNGSGVVATQILQPIQQHFGYNPEAEYTWRSEFEPSVWVNILQIQLDCGHPLIYRGTSSTVGHIFVCDGYLDDEYFHFNWGWNGNADGYFYINNLNPNGYTFNLNNYCITNFYPTGIYPEYCQETDTLRSITAIIDDGSGPIFDYSDNADCVWLIAPQFHTPITTISLHFRKFQTEENGDFLKIFSGQIASDNLVVEFSGNMIPEDMIVNSDTVFLVFTANNNGIAMSGWEVEYFAGNSPVTQNPAEIEPSQAFTISPNPSGNIFTLTPNQSFFTIKGAEVYDLSGKLWLDENGLKSIPGHSKTLDLHWMPPGMYVLKITYGSGELFFTKLLKY